MLRYTSLTDFEAALQAIDGTVVVRQVYSEVAASKLLATPPPGKEIARIDGGMNNIILIFNATGPAALSSVLFAGAKGGEYVIETGLFGLPTLGTPVEVRVHDSPQALEDYLITKQANNLVTVYADESAVVVGSAYRFIVQPGRYVKISGTQPATMLYLLDFQGKFLTVFK